MAAQITIQEESQTFMVRISGGVFEVSCWKGRGCVWRVELKSHRDTFTKRTEADGWHGTTEAQRKRIDRACKDVADMVREANEARG